MSLPEPSRERPLARWVEPPLDDLAIEKQWRAIRDRRQQRKSWALRWVLGGSGALALGGALLFVVIARAPEVAERSVIAGATISTTPGAVVESGAAPIDVRLEEGSAIALQAHTRLEAAEAEGDDVRFSLRRGRATFEVARNPSRHFVVAAGDVDVVVIGTRFEVTHEDDRVAVRVERGIVEVQTPRGAHRLGAGETWSGDAVTRDEEPEPAVEVSEDEPRERPRPQGPSATELFEASRQARREGRHRDAAEAYEQLLRRYPRDGHAGIASFELARLRMDTLGDPRGAIEPLERAIAARVFREDAMARLVRAYDETGQTSRCRAARQRYAREYADGVHLHEVQARCE